MLDYETAGYGPVRYGQGDKFGRTPVIKINHIKALMYKRLSLVRPDLFCHFHGSSVKLTD